MSLQSADVVNTKIIQMIDQTNPNEITSGARRLTNDDDGEYA